MNMQRSPRPWKNASHFGDKGNNRVGFGLLILAIGLVVLLKRLGFFHFQIRWPMITLAFGLFLAYKHQFRSVAAWILISLSLFFLLPGFFILGVHSTHLILPLVLVSLGLYLLLKPQKKWNLSYSQNQAIHVDTINLESSFAERSYRVDSKQFKGGSLENNFGATKLNLMEADSQEPITLHLKVSFGSVDIYVPDSWIVDFQVSNSFASVSDKRYLMKDSPAEKKLLLLQGSCSFGAINILSA